jgi:hypothetical protein
MKAKYYIICLLTLATITSCSAPQKRPIEKLNSHIAKVEKEYVNYTYEEWEVANIEFEKIVANIEANYDKMSPAERDAAMKAIGRYYGLVAKQGIQNAAQETQKALEALPSLIEGFTDAFK